MRISRKRKPQKPLIPHYNVSDQIQAPEVRVLDRDGANLGVMTRAAALAMASEQEVDLVEINPKAEPPVTQLVEFSHFKYQKEKEAKKQKLGAHVSETKGIRLSVRISEHDMDVRRTQAEKFLDRGDKVKAEIILRGREHARPDIAFDVIRKFFAMVEKNIPIRVEQEISKQANKVTGVIAKR
jgi:translation initiation factor IF-3